MTVVGTGSRRRAGVVAAVLLAGAAAAPVFGPLTMLPAVVAVAVLAGVWAGWPCGGRRLAAVTAAAGAVSLAATTAIWWWGEEYDQGATAQSAWAIAETAALLVLIVLVVRVAPLRQAVVAGSVAGAAVPAWLLRFGLPTLSAATLGGLGAWSLLALLAAATGLYLRSLDERRARTVLAARRTQRLQLARDLHDFVAHDVSEMLAQAQAGQFLASRDPGAAAAAFQRIEQAALRALGSMDRTVHMLHDVSTQDTARAPLPTLTDLADLVDRFSATGAASAQLDIDPALGEPAREVSTTVYRVVVEALTNVRRHAPAARQVRVVVRRTADAAGVAGPGVRVIVTDDGCAHQFDPERPGPVPPSGPVPQSGPVSQSGPVLQSGPFPPSGPVSQSRAVRQAAPDRGGFGLPGLTERVEALGGTLTAGRHPPSGWRVAAVLPLVPAAIPAAGALRPAGPPG